MFVVLKDGGMVVHRGELVRSVAIQVHLCS